MKLSNGTLARRNLFMQVLMIFWPPVFVFSLHIFLVRVIHIYDFIPTLDIPMHYLGGLVMAYSLSSSLIALQEHKVINSLDRIIELIFVFTLVATIAVFWEFAEFLADHFLGTDLQVSLANTMQDLLMGILGATTLIAYKFFKNSCSGLPNKQ